MKIVSTIGGKGGIGKTTASMHTARELQRLFPCLRFAIADADPQGSSSNWVRRGTKNGIRPLPCHVVAADGTGKNLKQELAAIQADVVIIDLPPAIEAISLRAALYSNLMLVPVGASPLEIEAAQAAVSVCKEAISLDNSKKFLLVPSRVRKNTASGKELRDVLKNWGEVSKTSISLRVAFADAAAAGEGIDTFAPGSPGHLEITALARQVAEILKLKEERQ